MKLTLACGQYDRTIPLQDGSVSAEGIELSMTTLRPGEIFRRQARNAEFDVAEFSLSTHSILLARGDARFVAIPIFLSRMFRHSAIYVRRDGQIRVPADLAGRRVGVQEFQQTAGVWIRGILKDEYGVRAEQIEWVFGTYDDPGTFTPRVALDLPPRIRHEQLPPDRSLDGSLLDGTVDAVIGAEPPRSFRAGRPEVVRLFPDYRSVELDYYRRTRIFPIMHVVVVKREICERDPWVLKSLYQAFVEARRIGRERVLVNGTLYCALPWFHFNREVDTRALGEDPFTYGLEANRRVLETFERYIWEEGIVARRLEIEELFTSEPLG